MCSLKLAVFLGLSFPVGGSFFTSTCITNCSRLMFLSPHCCSRVARSSQVFVFFHFFLSNPCGLVTSGSKYGISQFSTRLRYNSYCEIACTSPLYATNIVRWFFLPLSQLSCRSVSNSSPSAALPSLRSNKPFSDPSSVKL